MGWNLAGVDSVINNHKGYTRRDIMKKSCDSNNFAVRGDIIRHDKFLDKRLFPAPL